eukprot:TRINITY_DN94351_c0_g1_i1.p1 TRINITY_DN94351_c0_g1~~TRINITY_DN94351_c0_g1_i1.p1  ORF type:complete len:282 (-),score=26.74 TRINITY_DN94351_c0_g1_i1:6-851(-)
MSYQEVCHDVEQHRVFCEYSNGKALLLESYQTAHYKLRDIHQRVSPEVALAYGKRCHGYEGKLSQLIWEFRWWIREDPDCIEFVPPTVFTRLDAVGKWANDHHDADMLIYASMHDMLNSHYEMAYSRMQESLKRTEITKHYLITLDDWADWARSTPPWSRNISPDKRSEIDSACQECKAWLTDMVKRQGARQKYEAPLVTCWDMNAKIDELEAFISARIERPSAPPGEGWEMFQDEGKLWWYYKGVLGEWCIYDAKADPARIQPWMDDASGREPSEEMSGD